MARRHFNGVKTALLLGVLWAILLGVGWLVANATDQAGFIVVFGAFGLVSTFVSYWFSDRIALAAMQARPISEVEAPQLYQMVRELSNAAGQPMPRLYISPTSTPNAFATGRNPNNAAVCVTRGIVEILEPRELRGVLGHELMHVYNRDILTSSIAAAIAGLITSAAQILFFFGGGRNREGGNPLAALAMVILAPLAATFVQLAISRTREFDADEDGAKLTNDPLALASALKKLERGTAVRPLTATPQTESVSHMMIANPFRGGAARLFSTHPPMEQRIARLEALAGYGGGITGQGMPPRY